MRNTDQQYICHKFKKKETHQIWIERVQAHKSLIQMNNKAIEKIIPYGQRHDGVQAQVLILI